MTSAAQADPWEDVPRLAVPVLWVAAGGVLAVSYAVRGATRLLVLAERLYEVLGHELVRAGRALLRVLGPLGLQLRRGLRPVLSVLWRARGWAGRALLRHGLVPLGNLFRTAWVRSRAARRLLAVAVRALLVRARPYLTVLRMMLSGLHTVVMVVVRPLVALWLGLWRRLVVQWRRWWGPVVRTARALRLLVADRFGPRSA